jgi:hypothetical protein
MEEAAALVNATAPTDDVAVRLWTVEPAPAQRRERPADRVPRRRENR